MSRAVSAAEESAPRLADLLTALSERQRRGEPADVSQAARDHPDLADELRRLWAAVQVAGAFGRAPSSHPRPPEPATIPSPPPVLAPASVPRRFGDYEL